MLKSAKRVTTTFELFDSSTTTKNGADGMFVVFS